MFGIAIAVAVIKVAFVLLSFLSVLSFIYQFYHSYVAQNNLIY